MAVPEAQSLNEYGTNDINSIINQIRQEYDTQHDYLSATCENRNIVLVGRMRTGKSTLISTIQDPFYLPDMPGLFADTRRITFNRIAASHNGRFYFFTIVDSPGLFDTVIRQGERLTNNTIKKYLDDCIVKDITDIHAFAFVFSSVAGINKQDIESMIFIKKNYPNWQRFFMLIITHCEERTDAERRAFLTEFFKHPEVIQYGLQNFFGLGFHFMGCFRPQLRNQPNLTAARNQIRNILEMRRNLLDYLVARQEKFNIHHHGYPYSNTILKTFAAGILIGGLAGYCIRCTRY